MAYGKVFFVLLLVCSQQVVNGKGFGELINRGIQHTPVAKRTDEDYEKCQRLTEGKKEKEAVLMIEGNRLLLTCPLCLPPKTSAAGVWRRHSSASAIIIPVHLDGLRIRVLADLSLEIINTYKKDSGIYFCQHENEIYAKYAVDIKETEPHRYVILSGKRKQKKKREEGLALKDLNLIIGMTWSEWSPCNRCGAVGKRRQVGICSVRKMDPQRPTKPVDTKIFDSYKSVPCRSTYLPKGIRELPVVKKMPSEFVIGFCKIPCPTKAGIVVITDSIGKVIDTVDNSKGIYSMHQPLPPLPPLARRKTVYEPVGKSIVLTCPGDTEGKFLIWRNDSYILNPSRVHIKTKGRVKIDLFNSLHIRQLRYSDSAVYSCWDNKRLVGTVRLQVTEKTQERKFRIYILNLGVLFTFLTISIIAFTVMKNYKLQTKE